MSRPPVDPVFFDPHRRRWPRVKALLVVAVVPVLFLLGFLLLGVLANPILPLIGLPSARLSDEHALRPEALPPPPQVPSSSTALSPRLRALEERQKKQAAIVQRARSLPEGGRRPSRPTARTEPTQSLRAGFLVDWDERSQASLKDNQEQLDLVFPEWLHLHGAAATLSEDQPAQRQKELEALAPQRPRLRVLPLVNNFADQEWGGEALASALARAEVRARVVEELIDFVHRVDGSGLCLDLEDLPVAASRPEPRTKAKGRRPLSVPTIKPAYLLLIRDLSAALHAARLQLAVCAPLGRADYPYRAVAGFSDYVVAMAYDQHWAGGEAGPVAGQSWYSQGLLRTAAEVPADKLVVALGNYAYDWSGKSGAEVLTDEEAVRQARTTGCAWQWDATSLNPYFGYRDGQNQGHQVWVLDATTAFNQLVAAQAVKPRGFALWRLGSEEPALWRIFARDAVLDADSAQSLSEVALGTRLEMVGAGEAMRVTGTPSDGVRDIVFDPARRLIATARFKTYPSPYVLTRYGAAPRKIVLTFDDGPDPDYTPAILDQLKAAEVPAVFFVVGSNGERQPELIDRIVGEGHEIGSHTFTHPNILQIPLRQLEVELAATQRLIAGRTGRATLLFRPPYGVDSEPRSETEIQAVEAVGTLGYLTVGMKLDPHDWSQPGVDAIVNRVLEQAERGDGNIVLLHDSGGDRSQTVAALPRLIGGLRERGFEFTSLAGLLGMPRDQLMPPLTSGGWRIWLDRAGFALITFGERTLAALFLLGVVLGVARLALIGALALCERRAKRRLVFSDRFRPPVAVIVPAYNEEKVVVQTVRSLLTADYPGSLEIIVVDDGSKDATFAVASAAFADEPRVRVLTKANGGKAAALNHGIAESRAEIVVGLDADTVFRPDTISKLVRHFIDPSVAAVAGNAKVGNRLNLLTRWQALEYITCQNLDRRAFAFLNCITVVPGAVGAWRRSVVQHARGFTHQTLAEDADLTMTIRRMGYRVRNEDEAVALTEAPDTVRGFVKQRFRWMFGTIQAAFRHRGALLSPRAGTFGFVALPNILIFQVFFPLISPVMDLMLLLSVGSWALEVWHHPGQPVTGCGPVVLYYLLFVVVDYLAAWLAFVLEPAEDKTLLFWLFLQRFFYRQLMYYVAVKSTIAVLRGAAVGWGNIERKATVPT